MLTTEQVNEILKILEHTSDVLMQNHSDPRFSEPELNALKIGAIGMIGICERLITQKQHEQNKCPKSNGRCNGDGRITYQNRHGQSYTQECPYCSNTEQKQ